jgi:hypothetical protein
MPLHPGPWQTPPPRQQAVDTYSGPLGAEGWNEQYADADPVTFGGSWAALLNPPITYSTSTSRDLTIEHIYDPIGYLGQPLEDWALTQGLLDITPQLHLPARWLVTAAAVAGGRRRLGVRPVGDSAWAGLGAARPRPETDRHDERQRRPRHGGLRLPR